MGLLFFKAPLQDAIRSGNKRTTIRRWDRPRLRAGQRAFAPGLGWLAIDAVELVELDHLSENDAHADGFESLAALRQMLSTLYPAMPTDGKRWFRVSFRPTQFLNRSIRSDGPPARKSEKLTRAIGTRSTAHPRSRKNVSHRAIEFGSLFEPGEEGSPAKNGR